MSEKLKPILEALAVQYGKSVADSFNYDKVADPDEKHREIVKKYYKQAKEILKWLSERYYIVKKYEAEKLARLTFENRGSDDHGLIDGLTDWVLDNFSDEYDKVVNND